MKIRHIISDVVIYKAANKKIQSDATRAHKFCQNNCTKSIAQNVLYLKMHFLVNFQIINEL